MGSGLQSIAPIEREAERAWAVSKDTTTIAVLEEFVRRYGDSHYATLARARMEELRKSQAAARTTVPPGFAAVPRPPGAPGAPGENITLLHGEEGRSSL